MTIDAKPLPRADPGGDTASWPVVSPDEIGVADFSYDLAYMGVYLKMEICNRSPYLVREAELRIDGRCGGGSGGLTSREVKVGPLFPGAHVHEEVGIGAPGGIYGVSFNSVAARAVRLTPPGQMVPATEYPDLTAEILDVTVDREAPDLQRLQRREEDEWGEVRTTEATAICIRVRNAGQTVVERVRLKLQYFEMASGEATGDQTGRRRYPVAHWIFDMPRRDWNPYQLPAPPDAVCDPADPLPPGQVYEFTLLHYGGGPHDWAGRLDATSIEICELKLRA